MSSASRRLIFDLGGLAVGLDCANSEWLASAAERFSTFRLPAKRAETKIHYRVAGETVLGARAIGDARRRPLRGRREGDQLELRGWHFSARLGTEVNEIDGPNALYPLDLTLRALLYEKVESALIVHAAAFAENDRGCLCAGPAGSGKSTLAGLFPRSALCDELAAIFWHHGEPWVAALPYWRGRPGQAPLQAVHFLVHGEEDRRRELSAEEAGARLRRQILWPTWDAAATRRALASFNRLLKHVPIFELHFLPRHDVWPLLSLEAA